MQQLTPLPKSDSSIHVPQMAVEKSQLTEKLDKAIDVRQLSAHDVVHKLRCSLSRYLSLLQWTRSIYHRLSIAG